MTTITQGSTLEAAREKLQETDKFRVHQQVLRDLEFDVAETQEGPQMTVNLDDSKVEVSLDAVKDLATIAEVPANYIAKCPASLQGTNLKYWLLRLSEKKSANFIVGDEKVQGITSPRFDPTPNILLLDALEKALTAPERDPLVYFEHGWQFTRLTYATQTEIKMPASDVFDEIHPGEDDTVLLGVDLINSLTNANHIELQPIAYRTINDTRILYPVHNGDDDKEMHRYKTDFGSPSDWVKAAAENIAGDFNNTGTEIVAAGTTEITDLNKALTAQKKFVPGPLREAVDEAFIAEAAPTVWGVACALAVAALGEEGTRASHRRQVEGQAGRLIHAGHCNTCHQKFQ